MRICCHLIRLLFRARIGVAGPTRNLSSIVNFAGTPGEILVGRTTGSVGMTSGRAPARWLKMWFALCSGME
jgi:hypothetical protein